MAIKDIQRRQTQAGRIRIGETKDTGRKDKHGKPIMRPVKLEKFRFTSPSKMLIEQVAAVYGGTPAEWHPQGGGAQQWEVYTEATSLPVVVPPRAVSQWYESWAGGACVRRCDGEREVLQDQPCQCSPEPEARQCKPTTRVSLMLAEVPGIGVWRLDSGGYYAATELPAVAELLAAAGGYVAARLELEERSARRPKADGSGMETRRWMVPVLHVDAAPAQLLALTGAATAVALEAGEQQQAIAAQPAAQAEEDPWPTLASFKAQIESKTSVEDLRALWRHIGETATLTKEQTAELTQTFWARKKTIETREPAEHKIGDKVEVGGHVFTKIGDLPFGPEAAPAKAEQEPDRQAEWTKVLGLAGQRGWNTAEVSRLMRETVGKDPTEADGWNFQQFAEAITSGAVT